MVTGRVVVKSAPVPVDMPEIWDRGGTGGENKSKKLGRGAEYQI